MSSKLAFKICNIKLSDNDSVFQFGIVIRTHLSVWINMSLKLVKTSQKSVSPPCHYIPINLIPDAVR